MFDLHGKTAIVTGATQGIGFAVAKVLAEHGAKVYACGCHNQQKTEAAAAQIPNAVAATVDVSREESIDQLYQLTGDVDILVLNASIQHRGAWDEFTVEQFDETVDCNLKSTYLFLRKYVPGMKNQGWGRIVTLGSVNQYNQHPELSLYGITKAAQMKMVKNYAPALAPYGVTINNVAPGAIHTPRNAMIYDNDTLRAGVEAKIPCGRFGEPEDIAPAVLLLCSQEGSYITGSEIIIDGGLSL